MKWRDSCQAVIPCLNEAARIGSLVQAVREFLPRVLVIDDGSEDRTAELARAAGADILRHDQPQGKGASLQAGWRRSLDEGFAWALCLDGDGQHAPSDIPLFLRRAEEGEIALVVGNRMDRVGSMPRVRRWTNRFMSWRLSRLAGQPLPDTQCGYRLMNLQAWSGISLSTEHFEMESEILIAFARAGHRIGFVPIQIIYGDERSKIHPVRDTIRWFLWLRRWQRGL